MKTFGRNRDGRLNSYHLDISYMRFSRYIAKQIFFAADACICLPENILFYSVPARDRKDNVLEVHTLAQRLRFRFGEWRWRDSNS